MSPFNSLRQRKRTRSASMASQVVSGNLPTMPSPPIHQNPPGRLPTPWHTTQAQEQSVNLIPLSLHRWKEDSRSLSLNSEPGQGSLPRVWLSSPTIDLSRPSYQRYHRHAETWIAADLRDKVCPFLETNLKGKDGVFVRPLPWGSQDAASSVASEFFNAAQRQQLSAVICSDLVGS